MDKVELSLAELDRMLFGSYVAGLVDGEGCFTLSANKDGETAAYSAGFGIKLRLDDMAILQEVRRCLRCGTIGVSKPKGNGNPQASFRVRSIVDLVQKVIPFFDEFKLRAKKARDYAIWREAVQMMCRIKCRKVERQGCRHGGSRPKWRASEIVDFLEYHDALRSVRVYDIPDEIKVKKFTKSIGLLQLLGPRKSLSLNGNGKNHLVRN